MMKKFVEERIKFIFDFEEFHFVFDKIILMLYFLFAGAIGGLVTIFALKDILNIDLNEKFVGITIDVIISSAAELFIQLAFNMLGIVLILRIIFLGIGKLIVSMINKKQVKEDASL